MAEQQEAKRYRGYRFQMLDHNWFLTHPGWQLLSFVDRGIYMELRLQAGRTRQETGDCGGHITIGLEARGKRATIEKWLAASPGISLAAARASLDRLREHGFIKIARGSGIVTLVRWSEEQGAPPSHDAAKQRKSRAERAEAIFLETLESRRGDYVTRDEVVSAVSGRVSGCKGFASEIFDRAISAGFLRAVDGDSYFVEMIGKPNNDKPLLPPVPPSTSDFRGGVSRVTDHTLESVTCHNIEIEKDMNISSNTSSGGTGGSSSGSGSTSGNASGSGNGSGSGGGGSGSVACADGGVVTIEDVWNGSPVDVAEKLVWERGKLSENSFAKALRDGRAQHGDAEGTRRFRLALEKLYNDVREGRPIRNRGKILNFKLREVGL